MNLYFAFMVDGKWVRILYGYEDMYCSDFDKFVDYVGWVLKNNYPVIVYNFDRAEENEVTWSNEVEKATIRNFYLLRNTLMSNNGYCVDVLDNEDRFIKWRTYLEF